ncbi:MAG: 30S ribosomal protein S9 [Treponema sp.]|jgi:small subunit ribosomal protein S9|nr:30S ribosomal protein S9 [Treponema sp.]MCI6593575.1 30S ribosomal protein S9 [Spirochaetia bacterium]MDD7533431.1 30S ribosomal protein S9 [Treponema sp.]MDY3721956.1 30S ribosomal protein S9 [Treponema sp.]MDY5758046.1 30S ribosomal protein S9 [Treponema sp.]
MVKNIAIGTGRRKTAVARVFVRDGSGKIVVNGKDVKEYFATAEQIQVVQQPLLVTSMGSKYDVLINVQGGGMNGQAAACLHGISRALVQIDPDARTSLKANGYLTRDSRMVERKKYGQKGARRRFQFSKR